VEQPNNFEAKLFDLEQDLIEFLELTVANYKFDPMREGHLVTYVARWAMSRGAVAPLERG
jgi:hypothetical protein